MDGKGGVHIIDWDDAKLAPKNATDVFLGGGIFRLTPMLKCNFSRLCEVEIDEEMLQYYRVCRALEEDQCVCPSKLLKKAA
ncbi:MAG: hypothetical protein R2688_02660 [Fimbriimonadaceae bacterium]